MQAGRKRTKLQYAREFLFHFNIVHKHVAKNKQNLHIVDALKAAFKQTKS